MSKSTFLISCGFAGVLLLTACGGSANDPQPQATPNTDLAPVFSNHPQNQTVPIGQSAHFSATASGSPAPNYQWQRVNAGGNTWTDIAGATGSALATAATVAGDDGTQFRVRATNRVNSVTSNVAVLSVSQSPAITSFTASSAQITSGASVNLNWTVQRATSLSLDPGGISVTGTSGLTVNPTTTTTYTLTAHNAQGDTQADVTVTVLPSGSVRIILLHHSTGGNVWGGGVPAFFTTYNTQHGTQYQISETNYPSTNGANPADPNDPKYPWANYPYDYWNLWVNHTGSAQDRGELNLDQIAADYDVIVFKHCFPVSGIGPDSDCAPPSISSEMKTVANYKLQYDALKARMRAFPAKKFVVWTGAALLATNNDEPSATRAKSFFDWVKSTWDEGGDNIFVWDFWTLETEGGLYLLPKNAAGDDHPGDTFCQAVTPLLGQRIVDVVEGRGDSGSLTGE